MFWPTNPQAARWIGSPGFCPGCEHQLYRWSQSGQSAFLWCCMSISARLMQLQVQCCFVLVPVCFLKVLSVTADAMADLASGKKKSRIRLAVACAVMNMRDSPHLHNGNVQSIRQAQLLCRLSKRARQEAFPACKVASAVINAGVYESSAFVPTCPLADYRAL